MLKCIECSKPLSQFFFQIGGSKLCSCCAKELINDISDFKVQLNKKEDKQW